MRRIIIAATAALTLAAVSGVARADVIDFSGLPSGDAGSPLILPGATFSTAGGFNYVASETLCPSVAADTGANCSLDLQVDLDAASSGISFTFLYNNNKIIGADIGDVAIFNGANLLGTMDLLVLDDVDGKDLVTLNGFSGVTRLVISSTDFGGLGFDDFTFTPGAVPEPATWALLIMGFMGSGVALRRRRARPELP